MSDTIRLLHEVNSGCKMATNSMEQVMEFVNEQRFKEVLDKYNQKHISIGDRAHSALESENSNEQDPGKAAEMFSWITTEVKLMLKADTHTIAKIMMDGCNMGIQSICKFRNEFSDADNKATKLADELIKTEEEFAKELQNFI